MKTGQLKPMGCSKSSSNEEVYSYTILPQEKKEKYQINNQTLHLGEGNGTPLLYFCLENPRTEEPGRLQFMGSLELDTTERLPFHFSLSCIGEGNGNPLQCSCLENPRDGGAWWAPVSGVIQSRTRLKRLSSSSV